MPKGLKGFQKGHTINRGKALSVDTKKKIGLANARRQPPLQRFWANIRKEKDCWLWVGTKDTNGYGQFSINGRAVLVHRFSYELHKGKIPKPDKRSYHGTCVLHTCDIPNCVKPKHLILGTQIDNIKDRDIKMRLSCKLNKHLANQIRETYKMGLEIASKRVSQYYLAEKYGVSRGTIEDIILNRTWK